MTVELTLTWAEMLIAAQVGSMRNVQSLKDGCVPGNGFDESDTWTANIEGAAGEMVVAKHLNVFWSGAVGNRKARDVAGFQIKTNCSRRYDDLIIRKTDPAGIYILVLSFVPRFMICGWLSSEDARQERWWRDGTPGRPAFFVPRSMLHPINTLPPISEGATVVPNASDAVRTGAIFEFVTGQERMPLEKP